MYSITHCFLKGRLPEDSMRTNGLIVVLCGLLMLAAALAPLISLPAVTWASEQPNAAVYDNLDTRLLPWIGSWRLVSTKVNANENELVQEFLLTISPGSNDKSIIMKGFRDETPLAEEGLIVDGHRHPLTDDKCTGWYQYSWSDNGKRLLFNSESTCQGDPPRNISGMSIFDDKGYWMDIQLLRSGEDIATNIRKYRNVDNDSVSLSAINANRISSARIAAGQKFTISEIIELSKKVESEVLEAALLEMGKPFPVNSKKLIQMADANVPARVVDLVVALSFPEKFNVHGTAISFAWGTEGLEEIQYFETPYIYCSGTHTYFPWHWASSTCLPCGYSYLGWYTDTGWYYSLWTSPYYYYTGGSGGGGHAIHNGTLIGGQGYISNKAGASTRHARPRNASTVRRGGSSQSSGGYSSSSSSGSYSSSSSGSYSGSGVVTYSAPPSASPSGYSSGRR